MSANKLWLSLGAAMLGAVVGTIAGLWGALAGAMIALLIPFAYDSLNSRGRLTRQIVGALRQNHKAIAIREVMKTHGVNVPTDCFGYDPNHPFVRALIKYRSAFMELETEHRVIHNSRESLVVGYVNPPNEWVNEWAGRAYQESPDQYQ